MAIELIKLHGLVHADFESTINLHSRREAQLRSAWDREAVSLAKGKDSALLYFSAFPYNPWLPDEERVNYPAEAVHRELTRREQYSKLLKERFIFYSLMERPNASLQLELRERGLTYDPNRITLTFYGEYIDSCVEKWMKDTQRALGLDDKMCGKDISLSLQRATSRKYTSPLKALTIQARSLYKEIFNIL